MPTIRSFLAGALLMAGCGDPSLVLSVEGKTSTPVGGGAPFLAINKDVPFIIECSDSDIDRADIIRQGDVIATIASDSPKHFAWTWDVSPAADGPDGNRGFVGHYGLNRRLGCLHHFHHR